MVTDDQTSRVPNDGRTLAELIAESPRGVDAERVIAWAGHLAGPLDETPSTVYPHRVMIAADDYASLAGADHDAERALLFGRVVAPSDCVQSLAATLFEALAGSPPVSPALPIPGLRSR